MPELPFELTRRRILVAAGCLALLLFVGSKLLARPQTGAALAPPAAAPTETAAAAPAAVVVDVVGAVRRPGLYRLAQGARIADAVSRAGGATPKADLALINLAAPLADGEQVVVPRRGTAALGAPAGPAGSSSPGGAPSAGPVHLSTATLEQLDSLPGIGPVTAQKILDYRQKHGAFTSVDELDAVPGIGPARLDQLKDLVAP
ncbi:MAG: ComEA family DNA-binding protein [Actinobacteria bacterium]|nr:MAG: ComEA family DNA-binding protein [Actinomycetota bacterium]